MIVIENAIKLHSFTFYNFLILHFKIENMKKVYMNRKETYEETFFQAHKDNVLEAQLKKLNWVVK